MSYLETARRVLAAMQADAAVTESVGDPDAPAIDVANATEIWQAVVDGLEGDLVFPPTVFDAYVLPMPNGGPKPGKPVQAVFDETVESWQCRCGSVEYRDFPIHAGRSKRRDCARCGTFVEFVRWYDN